MADQFALYQRRWSVTVDTLKVTGLRVIFNVKKALTKDPNTAEVTICNLSDDSRKKIEQSRGKPLIITAGYEKTEAIIFSGDVRFASSARDRADWKTKIESGDGEIQYGSAHFKGSFGKGTSTRDVIKAAANALGVGTGNLDKMIGALRKPTHTRGYSASGRASDVLDDLLRAQGLTFSIQGGQLQVMRPGEAVDPFALRLSSDTGLIGSPETTTPKDATKTTSIRLRSYLQPQLKCGGVVSVESTSFRSEYIVQKLEHMGDSHGAGWYSVAEVNSK
jgi:hypothetical protein